MSGLSISLPDAVVEAVAARVLERLEQQQQPASPWLTVDEAAQRMRCKRQRVYDLTSAGTLKPARDGRRLLFHVDHIDDYLTTTTRAA